MTNQLNQESYSSVSLRQLYVGVVARLDAMASDPKRYAELPKQAIFVNDQLLRLRLWGSEIKYNDGSLERAEEVAEVSEPLGELLRRLEEQSSQLESKQANQADVELNLRHTVTDLNNFITPLKAASSIPEPLLAERKHSRPEVLNMPRNTESTYMLLKDEVSQEGLLGAIIIDPINPTSHYVPASSDTKVSQQESGKFGIITTIKNNYSIISRKSALSVVHYSTGARFSVGASSSKTFEAAQVEIRTIGRRLEYFNSIKRNPDVVEFLKLHSTAYLVFSTCSTRPKPLEERDPLGAAAGQVPAGILDSAGVGGPAAPTPGADRAVVFAVSVARIKKGFFKFRPRLGNVLTTSVMDSLL